jgi:TetR/AcrR family transcriptional regulator
MSRQNGKQANEQGARNRLLNAAMILFSENGYSATPVRSIAERAGVTKPVLYYYFGSKDGLFRSLLEYAEELHKRILQDALNAPGGARDRLEHLFRAGLTTMRENRELARLMFGLTCAPPHGEPGVNAREYADRTLTTIKSIYRQGVASGEMVDDDPDAVAFLMMALIDYSTIWELTEPEPFHPDMALKMLDLVFKGIGAKGNES